MGTLTPLKRRIINANKYKVNK
uniref:Uncharacterized protein n=1 Tax=Amphimedon queenslandica TaxID=400682 RepID=A0A1X7U093_AMPQE